MTFGYLLNTPESLTRSFSAPPPPPPQCLIRFWLGNLSSFPNDLPVVYSNYHTTDLEGLLTMILPDCHWCQS